MAEKTLITRLNECAAALQARANNATGESRDYWGDRAQLVRGWAADLRLGFRNDFDVIEMGLEEFERMVK